MKREIIQKQKNKIADSVIREQLSLNRWLDQEQMIKEFCGEVQKHSITIHSTDYGPEAVIVSTLADGKEENIIPGFYIAKDREEITIEKELQRACEYIDRKYIPRLRNMKEKPICYKLDTDNIKVSIDDKIIDFDIHRILLNFRKEQEYWERYLMQGLGKYTPGKAVRMLVEVFDYHNRICRQYPNSPREAWARSKINYSLARLLDMVKRIETPRENLVEYQTKNGTYLIDDLEFKAFYHPYLRNKIIEGQSKISIEVANFTKI